ncbi:MAG: N-acetyltransferase [Pseudomonadota bacterium]
MSGPAAHLPPSGLILREEREDEYRSIHDMTVAAFSTVSYGDGTEGEIIDRLRADGDLSLSTVAELEGVLVGQVSLSPAKIGEATGWFGLGPIAVAIDHMRQGIGSALVRHAVDWACDQGAAGVCLVGSHEYYPRFGFQNDGDVSYLDLTRKYVHWLTLSGPDPKGAITFAPALHGA